ncbi:tripartite motif-containing protein 5-like [Octodon degus]|uniref:Tripartite motif-containing protein 5-like n=1 Tax=Octodon degus TaxID=10160 RepID=A0A6P3VE22_OCTDE|nr:tripartite motif-containing protein 5-like [Octodon degus]
MSPKLWQMQDFWEDAATVDSTETDSEIWCSDAAILQCEEEKKEGKNKKLPRQKHLKKFMNINLALQNVLKDIVERDNKDCSYINPNKMHPPSLGQTGEEKAAFAWRTLHEVLEKLTQDEKEFKKLEAHNEEERTPWKKQIQEEIQNVQDEFTKMRNILDSEEKEHLQKLNQEEEDILRVPAESEKQLAQNAQSMRELISDVQHQLQGSAMAMLQGVKETIEWSKLLTMQKPRTCPNRQDGVPSS